MYSKLLLYCALIPLLGHVMGAEGQPSYAGHVTPGAVQLTFPPGRKMVELAMQGTSDRPLVEVSVNGNDPAVFALDTGTTTSVWLGSPLPGITGSASAVMELAGLRIEGVRLQTIVTPQLGDLPFDGILGTQVFSSLVVVLDWQVRVVRLYDTHAFEAPPGVIPVEVDTTGGYVVARGTVMVDEAQEDVELFVDTGAGYALTLREGRIAPPARLIVDSPIGKGLHGIINGSVGRVKSLELGAARLNGIVTQFVASETMIMPPQFEAGIGFEMLKRFVVFLDLRRGQMLLAATDAVSAPFKFTVSGLKLLPGVNADGATEVFGVVPDSPAANVGIQAGDFIKAVNGRPVAELGFDRIEDAIDGEPGAEVTLDVWRGTDRRTVRLTLQQLL